MVIFRAGEVPPGWCELRAFAVHAPGAGVDLERREVRERLLVTRGRCQVIGAAGSAVLRAGQFLDMPAAEQNWRVRATTEDAECVHLSGRWGAEVAGCGIWTVVNEPDATDKGDPVEYPKVTRIDSHYHDYDEYWIVLEGGATAVVGGDVARIAAGDCVATGAGHHHDLPEVDGVMRGLFFETSLVGRKRLGHLWEHTHGPAVPDPAKL